MKSFAIAAILLSVSSPGFAQAPPPACTDPGFHGWDFWLGRWQVSDAKGILRGTNEITAGPGGCGLSEHWRSVTGGEGTSLNAYDPVSGDWTQFWVSPTETIRLRGKISKDGALRTNGTITANPAKTVHPFRGNWVPLSDGSVRQEFFEQDPQTKQWSTWFVGIYRREK